MFLDRAKRFVQGLRFRIAAGYFILVVISSVALFGFLYYLLAETLKEKDHRIVASDFKTYAVVVNLSGADGLKSWFEKKQNLSQSNDVFVRLKATDGHLLFLHEPAIMNEMDRAQFQNSIDTAKDDVITTVISPRDSEDAVEFYSDHLANGLYLQVGKDTDDREELLGRFREAFSIIIAIALLTALASAFLFSQNILRPIRNLISTVENVRRGDLLARAQVTKHGDEINDLAKFLNGMLAQNSKLISALTESLDAVAHDLRTPLTRLRVHAERALQSTHRDPDQVIKTHVDAFGAILENTDQVIQLLDAILDVSEAKAGTLAIHPRRLNLRQTLLEVADVYSVVADDKKMTLVTDQIADVEFTADIRIKQVVANLIDNAIKFSPIGSTVHIRASKSATSVSISVEDEGPGISKADEAKIWDRLYRGDSSRSTRGMGLGLSLVQSIVLAHGGTISVALVHEHEPNPGSRFEILLPIRETR